MKDKNDLVPIFGIISIIFITVFYIFGSLYIIKQNTYNQYDVNRDGKVNSQDLLELRKYLINEE